MLDCFRSFRLVHAFCLFGVLSGVAASAFAQDDELKYGLIGTYTDGQTPTKRVDPSISFAWNQSPIQGDLQTGKVSWKGKILIRDTVPHQFHAGVSGRLSIQLDGKTIALQADTKDRKFVSGPKLELSPGFHEFSVDLGVGDTDGKESVLKLFWSSDAFPIEPIPPHVLFHEEDDSEITLIEEGRQLFEAHRCHRCHGGMIDPEVLPAAALWGVTEGMNPEWLVKKLLNKNYEAPHSKMPNFGLSQDEAECISAYLLRQNSPFDFESVPKQKPGKNDPDGTELLHSVGCLACHKVNDLGTVGPFGGGDLSKIGAKRSPEWLATWLDRPERMNPQHRMPVFKLTPSERRLIVETLSKLGGDKSIRFEPKEKPSSIKAERGRQLMKDYRCANCHKIPAVEADLRGYSTLEQEITNWDETCLGNKADSEKHRPIYSHTNREALKAFVNSQVGRTRGKESDYALGQHVLVRRNCLACHKRGTSAGIVETAGKVAAEIDSLKGKTQLLIPPNLSAIGDKLTDEVFQEALSGNHDRVRANWLKIRMPKFAHKEDDLEMLKTYFVEHDRIPEAAVPPIPDVELSPDERLLTGRKLIGAGAFSCIACHQVGDYKPKNVALGTRGSNLLNIQKRIRPEFYHRWTRAPLRVVTGMEMPSYQKPVKGILNDDVNLQLTALWKALGDPKFTPPANPTQVEKYLQLTTNDTPKVLRDVFTVDDANGGGYVARSFAMGFPNQHSLLFDIDRVSMRAWRFGDFATLRTEGKSWYWNLAGVQLATGFNTETELVLLDTNDNSPQPWTHIDPARLGHLQSYLTNENHVELVYSLKVEIDQKPSLIVIKENLMSQIEEGKTSIVRKISSSGLPKGFALGWRNRPLKSDYIQTEVTTLNSEAAIETADSGTIVPFKNEDLGQSLTIHYTAQAMPQPLQPVQGKVIYPDNTTVTTLPGYIGDRLHLPASIMPTAITWDHQNRLVFTSLKGDVLQAVDSSGDGSEDSLNLFDSGLPAPFGILADGEDLLIGHKAELLRLHGSTSHGMKKSVVADGWGYTDNYHDWTTGPVRDSNGNLYLATGSDYSQKDRADVYSKWRGKVVKVDPAGKVTAFAHQLRYPQGIAIDHQDRLFVTDQQGVRNTQNEINHVLQGKQYGMPARLDELLTETETRAAVQVPHPWTRSVNGMFFLPKDLDNPFAGHGIGCEYNGKFLIRVSMHEVNGALQGATYPFTNPEFKSTDDTFLGPICGAVAKNGDIYIGSIYDSGWLGGPNSGEIIRLRREGEFPNGIKEVRATATGFEIEFVKPVPNDRTTDPMNYSISGQTWQAQGSYTTPPSGTYQPKIEEITLSDDKRTATLKVAQLKEKFVYEIYVKNLSKENELFFPSFAAYSMNQLVEE